MRRLLSLTAVVATVTLPLAARADATGDVLAAGKNFAALKYWHADEAFSGRAIHVDFAAPDRYRLEMPTGTQYLIGNDMYISVGGRTMKMTMPQAASTIAQLRSPAQAAAFAKTRAIKDLGPSTVAGVPTHAYAFDDTTSGITTHNVLDVGPRQLPYRMTVKSSRGTVTVTYGKFDVPVTITPPA